MCALISEMGKQPQGNEAVKWWTWTIGWRKPLREIGYKWLLSVGGLGCGSLMKLLVMPAGGTLEKKTGLSSSGLRLR